jgi:hypothetical protein
MARLLAHVQKLQGRSLDELRVRGVQAMRAHLERLRTADGAREPDDARLLRLVDGRSLGGRRLTATALLEHFRERAPGRFFAGLTDRAATTAAFRRRWPEPASSTIQSADRIVKGILDVFGHEIAIGAHPDWALEPLSGRRTALVHWSRIAYLDPRVSGDCKVTWEINRHQYFLTLGRAYWLTGDERYAWTFVRHLASWMDENPPNRGINWASSLEVALRSIAWIWALLFFRDSAHLDERLFTRAIASLDAHGRHIETYLSTYFSPNTHLTGEALGLLQLGLVLPELRRAAAWRDLGARLLEEQLHRQVLPDGVYFEQSTYYHRYTADFYLYALILADAHGLPLAAPIRARLPALLEYLLTITRPDGRTPLIGDDDGGRLLPLGSRPSDDFRDTLGIGAIVLRRGDLAHVAGSPPEEALWLLGQAGVSTFDALPPAEPTHESRAFAASGYYVIRDGWRSTSDYAVIRCGPHGALTGAHAHADALAIELTLAGRPLLVDSGTYTYAALDDRNAFRATAAHNSVTVDDLSSAAPGPTAFTWQSTARARTRSWVTHPRFDFFEGEHDGYERREAAASHLRSVFFLKGEYWVIADSIDAAGPHRATIHLHFAPGVVVRSDGHRALLARHADGAEHRLQLFAEDGLMSCEEGRVSPAYRRLLPAPSGVFRRNAHGPHRTVMVIADASAMRWQHCEWREASPQSAALTLVLAASIDTILIGDDDRASPLARDGVSAYAHWTWVRRSLSGEPTDFVSVGARSLAIDGVQLLSSAAELEMTAGRKTPDGWQVEVRRDGALDEWIASGSQTICVGSAE